MFVSIKPVRVVDAQLPSSLTWIVSSRPVTWPDVVASTPAPFALPIPVTVWPMPTPSSSGTTVAKPLASASCSTAMSLVALWPRTVALYWAPVDSVTSMVDDPSTTW